MKKIVTCLMCIVAFINCHSQNVYFMGIPLGESVSRFNNMLCQKEFRKVNSTKDIYGRTNDYYEGYFWKSDYNSIVTLISEGGIVNHVSVQLGTIGNRPRCYSNFRALLSSMINKYGTPKESFGNEVPKSETGLGSVCYYWEYANGYIKIDYNHTTRIPLEITISYSKRERQSTPKRRSSGDGDL